LLRDQGYDVLTAYEAGMAHQKHSDGTQLRFATSQGRAMFTFDKVDYIQLAHDWIQAGSDHSGIIITQRRSEYELRDRLRDLFEAYPDGIANLFFHI
jgi:hypothetical protein